MTDVAGASRMADLRFIADHYGVEHQKQKLVEELAELIQAVCKGEKEQIMEEMADVAIMLEQTQYLLGITPDTVEDIERKKIMRQIARIWMEEPHE